MTSCSTDTLLPFFSLYLQSKAQQAGKMQQSMDAPLKDYHVLMHLFGENNVLHCSLFSTKSIWNYLSCWERTEDKMNTDYTCFTSKLNTHPQCKSFMTSSQNKQGSVVRKHLQSQNSSPSHIHTNTLISSNCLSPLLRKLLFAPTLTHTHTCSGNQQDPARTQSAALCPSLQDEGKVFNMLQTRDDRVGSQDKTAWLFNV